MGGQTPAASRALVHIVPSLQTGGLEMLLKRLVTLQTKAWNVHVLCIYERGNLADEVVDAGAVVHSPPGGPLTAARIFRHVVGVLRRIRPDVVHTHNPGPHFHGVLSFPLVRPRTLVHTRHGQQTRGDSAGRVVNALSRRWTTKVIAVSEDVARLVHEAEGFPRSRISVLRNAVDLDSRTLAIGPLHHAIAVGRLHPAKDYGTMLQAAALVLKTHPQFRLTIAGAGYELDRLTHLHRRLQLGDRVQLIGNRSDVASLLERSGMYVMSSVSEGVPLTVLEAMAAGLPIVATSVGGLPEVLENEQTALLVAPSEPKALSDAIIRLLKSPTTATYLGANARQAATTRYSIVNLAAEYERIYRAMDAL